MGGEKGQPAPGLGLRPRKANLYLRAEENQRRVSVSQQVSWSLPWRRTRRRSEASGLNEGPPQAVRVWGSR